VSRTGCLSRSERGVPTGGSDQYCPVALARITAMPVLRSRSHAFPSAAMPSKTCRVLATLAASSVALSSNCSVSPGWKSSGSRSVTLTLMGSPLTSVSLNLCWIWIRDFSETRVSLSE
jgi:hypothetical protein